LQKLSVVICNFNEAAHLLGALQTCSVADEVLVVDAGSDDDSERIAGEFGARVLVRQNEPVNVSKNFGFREASGDWIFSLDTDERITANLANEIRKTICDNFAADGYFVKRRNFFGKRWLAHGGWYPDYQLRLFRRGRAGFECRHIHEVPRLKGRSAKLEYPIDHYTYKNFADFWRKYTRYTAFEAQYFRKHGTRRKLPFVRYLAIEPIRLSWDTYFAKRGYLDGGEGLIIYALSSLYPTVSYLRYRMSL
jgi:glycosyltransferase involved in cell wall biosynthesis